MPLVIRDMGDYFNLRLVTVRNASMQGVGTKIGTRRRVWLFIQQEFAQLGVLVRPSAGNQKLQLMLE
jgi:hypothetical protein